MSETVVITGASSGVGRATAIEFAKRGYRVGLIARGRAGLDGAAADVEAAGGTAATASADVANADELEHAATQLEQQLGPIDIWHNNAMVTTYSTVGDLSPEEFRRITEVTYLGAVNGTMVALARFQERGSGRISFTGSAMAYQGIPLQSAYCGAKAAIKNFVESLRTELRHQGSDIGVTIVHLPGMNTPQFVQNRSHIDAQPQPVPPIYQPEVAAEAIVHAVTSGRDEFWVGIPTIYTIAGNKFASRLMEAYLAKSGVSSQKAGSTMEASRRSDNLFAPADDDEDMGVRGPFDDQAHSSSVQLKLNEHRAVTAAIGAVVAAGVAVLGARALRDGS